MKPSAKDKARYLAKIEEWKNLGFDVSGLAELLDSDFEMFKKRRLEILRGQIGDTPKKIRIEEEVEEEVEEPSEPYEKEVEEEVEEEEAEDESTILVGAPVRKARPKVRTEKEDKLMLVGKPLPVEPPPPEDEETILIGDLEEEEEVKPKKVKEEIREPKVSDAARVRELEAVEEPREKKREAEEEEEVEKEEEEEEAEVPMSMLGMEVPPEKKSKEAKAKPKPGARPPAKTQSVKIAAVGIAGILIMAVLLWMIYIETSQDGNGNGITPGELEAVIEVDNTQAYAGETLNFNAARSIGEISAYQWIFDTDFILTSGSDTSIYVGGYFAQTVAEKNEYTVSLTVETAEGQLDSDSISITINPLEVIVSEELLGDSGLFLSEGNITVTNPDNIASFSYNSGSEFFGVMDININNILLNFRNVTNDPMSTSIFDSPSQIASGFNNLHDVYIREIRQNLEISGSMDASMTSTTAGSYQETLPITGTMNSVETSYTDYTTGHTIQIHTTNDLDLDSEITEPVSIPLEMQSTDELTSFPDLRATPSRLRLADLSEDPIELGDRDTIIYDNVAYSWIAVSADQASGNQALKLEFHLDSGTLKDNNIDEFYLHLWLGNNYPVALKSVLHVQFTIDGNTVVMNYANQLKGYTAGSTSISSQECNEEFDSNNHYPVVYSDMDSTLASDFADDWNYLPSLKKSNLTNSFEAFSPDNAMTSYILPLSGVNDYLNNYPEAYVTTAYCNRTDGELIWNVTFGSKDEPNGYNVLVSESGVKYDMAKTIDPPRNGTDDLWPVLTFAGSEYIFKNLDDDDINVNIFTGGSINFDSASYGITADLSYPTVDFTSVTNFQTQKLAYYAATKDGSFITALDAETGQLLFKLKHEYTGIDIPI